MTISKRTRERAAEVVREWLIPQCPDRDDLEDLAEAILAIPDDEQEGAIRAAVVEEAAALMLRTVRDTIPVGGGVVKCDADEWRREIARWAESVRALAPAPSGWVCVRVEDLEQTFNHECPVEVWRRLRAALPEDPNG